MSLHDERLLLLLLVHFTPGGMHSCTLSRFGVLGHSGHQFLSLAASEHEQHMACALTCMLPSMCTTSLLLSRLLAPHMAVIFFTTL